MFGDLLESVGLSGLLSDGQWRTLHNGRRVKLDSEGRILAGLPSKYHGVHVRDLSELTRKEREIEKTDCADTCAKCPKTFADKAQAVAALLDANPRSAAPTRIRRRRWLEGFPGMGAPRPAGTKAEGLGA